MRIVLSCHGVIYEYFKDLYYYFMYFWLKYGNQIKHWIIWNEPDISFDHPGAQFDGSVEDYYRLVKVAYIVAKEVDPDAVIHLGGLTYWHDIVYGRESYLRRLLEVVTSDKDASSNNFYFDVATVHVYFDSESVYKIISCRICF